MTKVRGLSAVQRLMMNRFYAEADGDPEKLPWHRAEPGDLLVQCAGKRAPGRALDIGCGSGVFSAYLASLGYRVTALDYHADAVAMAAGLAGEGPAFDVVEADILEYRPEAPFDFVYDSGCLHNFNRDGVARYGAGMGSWLADDGDFVLEHWGKRHALDWRPIGPYRRSQSAIVEAFSPRYALIEARSEIMDLPFPLGPKVRGDAYHFRRK